MLRDPIFSAVRPAVLPAVNSPYPASAPEEGPEVVPITWDPLNKGPEIALSAGNTVATSAATDESDYCVRSVQSFPINTPGKYVVEIDVGQLAGGAEDVSVEVGFVSATPDLTVANPDISDPQWGTYEGADYPPSTVAMAIEVIGDGTIRYWQDLDGGGWIGLSNGPGDPTAGAGGNPRTDSFDTDIYVLAVIYVNPGATGTATIKAVEDFNCTIPSGYTVLAAA